MLGSSCGIETPADLLRLFKDPDVTAQNTAVTNEEGSRSERGDSTPNEVNYGTIVCMSYVHICARTKILGNLPAIPPLRGYGVGHHSWNRS